LKNIWRGSVAKGVWSCSRLRTSSRTSLEQLHTPFATDPRHLFFNVSHIRKCRYGFTVLRMPYRYANNNKLSYAGQLNGFTHRRAILILCDRGVYSAADASWVRIAERLQTTLLSDSLAWTCRGYVHKRRFSRTRKGVRVCVWV